MTATAPTTPTATRTQVDSKALYAKLLANENLVVEHDPNAETAYFDTVDRRLVLPVWQGMSNEVYNMLVGHEVAHALFTPTGKGWVDDLVKIDPNNANTVKGYFNVVEDARIERLLKQKYPGLRRDFLDGYDHMVKSDIFKIQDKDLAEMGFIDRINLHYKIGVFVNVPFTAEEMPLVTEVAKTSTYADALDLTKRLYEFAKEQKRREREEQQENGEGAGAGNDQDQDQDQQGGTGGDEGDEQEGDEGGQGGGEKFENLDKTEEATVGGDKGDTEVKGDKGEKGDLEGSKEGGNGSGSGAGTTNGELNDAPEAPVTDGALDRAAEKFRDDRDRKSDYIDLPRWRNEATESPAEIIKAFNVTNCGSGWTATGARLYREFLEENQNAINLLYREFEQRRAADVQRRTRTAESGSIDVNRLWAYRVSEEVFATYQTVRDGQNHGLIFFIDWSGSMSATLYETVKQCLCLAEFCRKAQIPFEVYAFSDNGSGSNVERWDNSRCRKAANLSYLRLINFLSSRSNGNEFKNAAMAFLCAGRGGRVERDCIVPSMYNLGGTPLNAAVVAALSIVPTFKAANRLQVVHTLFLTDGGAGDDIYVEDYIDHYGNGKKEKTTRCAVRPYYRFNGWQTAKPNMGYSCHTNRLLLELLEAANPGTNVIGFFLESARNLKNHHGMQGNDGYVCRPKYNGYTQWFGIANAKCDETDYWDRLSVKSNITATTVRTAMAREFAKVRGNRQFLARFAEIISKERK